jgi:endogenous inhibitor of DNA gyrase (YacG/DUF329 family)
MKLSECPLCRKAIGESNLFPVPKMITRKLDELEVYCPDCNKVQKRGDLKSHLEKCSFVCPMVVRKKSKQLNKKIMTKLVPKKW